MLGLARHISSDRTTFASAPPGGDEAVIIADQPIIAMPPVASARSQLRDVYLKEWLAFESLERLRDLFDLIERWKVMHAVITDAEWVAAYQKELNHCVPLRHSFTEWSLRRRQYYLAKIMRRLVEQNL